MAVIDGLAPHMHVKDDTVVLIHALKSRGHRLVYLSNMPHGLSHWIEDGTFSARVGLMKPDPAIFQAVNGRLAISDPSSFFIDDPQRNIDAAHAMGWRGGRFTSSERVGDQLGRQGLIPL